MPKADALVANALQLLLHTQRVRIFGDTPPDSGARHVDYTYYNGSFRGTALTDDGVLGLTIIGNAAYIDAPIAIWRKFSPKNRLTDEQLAKLAGKWISTTATAAQKQNVSLRNLMPPLRAELSGGHITREVADGPPVYVVTTDTDVARIAAGARPYLLSVRYDINGTERQLTFSQYDATAPIAPPQGAQTVREALME